MGTCGQGYPRVIVHGIEISHPLGTVQFLRREFDTECIVEMRELKLLCFKYRSVDNFITTAFHTFSHGLVMQIKIGYTDIPFLGGIRDFLRIKISDAIHSAKPDETFPILIRSVFTEFVTLQPVTYIIVDKPAAFGVELRDTGIGTYPQIALTVTLDGVNGIAWQAVGRGIS